jgi:hypothetical protein
MLEVFFDSLSLVHYEFILEGRNVSWNPLSSDAVRMKRPQKLAQNSWFLLYKNLLAHQLLMVKYLTKHNLTALEHPPYSLDLWPFEFFLFQRLKCVLKGQRFTSADEVTIKIDECSDRGIEIGFQEFFLKPYKSWQKCATHTEYEETGGRPMEAPRKELGGDIQVVNESLQCDTGYER